MNELSPPTTSAKRVPKALPPPPPQLAPLYANHIERLRSSLLDAYSLKRIPRWIQEKTTLEGAPFSFAGHEYQLRILEEEGKELVIKKCSQVGISELAIRRTLAIMDILPDIHVIYTLPTSKFAKIFVQTRIDPVIQSSPYLRERIDGNLDSTEMKRIGSSYLYIKGTIGQSAAISVPASMLVHDEVDFSDQDVLSSYQSRMTHSRFKLKLTLSTPTAPYYGIDGEFMNSRRHFNQCKCNHCGRWFLPDYFTHVKVPGFDGDLREITKENLHITRYGEAKLHCPHCGGTPDLGPENRQWVLENTNEAHNAAGFQISPFDAPSIITPAYLIETSTKYRRYLDFINFGLGLAAKDAEGGLLEADIQACYSNKLAPSRSRYVIGIDAGMVMHLVVAAVGDDNNMIIVEARRCGLASFLEVLREISTRYYLGYGVMDCMPYADLVLNVQRQYQTVYGAIYVRSKTPEIFTVHQKDENAEGMKGELRAVNINRNKALDVLMQDIKRGKLAILETAFQNNAEVASEFQAQFTAQMTDMVRIGKYDDNGDLFYVWEKSTKGRDHFHHALLYAYTACQMLGFGEQSTPFGFVLGTFKNKVL